jgi:hypothetical protein
VRHSPLDEAALAAWVEASCAAQGVPVKVTDPTVVRRVGVLLGAEPEGVRARKRSGTRTPSGAASVPPDDLHAGRVQAVDSGRAGTDRHVVDQCSDDRVLTRQVQGVPRSA